MSMKTRRAPIIGASLLPAFLATDAAAVDSTWTSSANGQVVNCLGAGMTQCVQWADNNVWGQQQVTGPHPFDAGMTVVLQPSNWTTAFFPDNGNGALNYDVTIGAPAPTDLNISVTIDNLTVNAGGVLNFLNSNDLTITAGGTFENNGTVSMNGTTFNTDLTFNGPGTVLSGNGTLTLGNDPQNRVLGNGSSFTQQLGHTIRGGGTLLNNTGGMVNQGSIIADAGTPITIDPDANGFVNQGTLQAIGAGGLIFVGGVYTNTNNLIEVKTDSKLDVSNTVSIIGGTLKSSGTGVINLNGSGTGLVLDNVTIATGSAVVQGNAEDAVITGGLTNNGDWNLNGTSFNSDLLFQGDITLGGSGQVFLNNDPQSRILSDGNTITHLNGHTIRGGGMINEGDIIADGAVGITIDAGVGGFVHNGTATAKSGSKIIVADDISGSGSWRADSAKTQLNSGVDVSTTGNIEISNGGELELNNASISGGTLSLDATSILDINSTVSLSGDLRYAATAEANWSWGSNSALEMTGGAWSTLEVGGTDIGIDPAAHVGDPSGFNNNFSLVQLVIGAGARVVLADLIDNGNRNGSHGAAEALYVDTLTFADPTGVLALNGLHLYYNNLDGGIGQVLPSAIPIPPAAWLFASALAGLFASQRRFAARNA